MTTPSIRSSWVLLISTALAACGPLLATPEAGSSGGTTDDAPSVSTSPTTLGTTETGSAPNPTSATTFDTTATATSATTTEDPSDSDSECDNDSCGGCQFLCDPDGGGGTDCDLWSQDCPDGEKCMPWANDGGNAWNATRCSPVARGPGQIGDACLVEGSYVSGIDSCDLGLMCMWVDPVANAGTCVSSCSGSEANPVCEDPATHCEIAFEGTMVLCLPPCDALVQDCPEGAACYPGDNQSFVCGKPLEPVIPTGEACEREWDCAPGAFCQAAALLPACAGEACCTAYCDTALPDACGPERVCTPIYPELPSAAGYCTVP